jgi:pre-mRNA-splicing factor 18
MDALKAEIASKRKALDNGTSRPNKYMRRGDIERMKEEEEQKAREEAAKKAELEEIQKAALPKVRSTNQPSPSTLKGTDTSLELRVSNPAAAPRL